jgi:uncharacterized membrane protein YeiH
MSPYRLAARCGGRLRDILPGQAPFFCVWKKPSFFGEYDTRRFFVCWWYHVRALLDQGVWLR